MSTLALPKTYDDARPLFEYDLDLLRNGLHRKFNYASGGGLDGDHFASAGITSATKIVDYSITKRIEAIKTTGTSVTTGNVARDKADSSSISSTQSSTLQTQATLTITSITGGTSLVGLGGGTMRLDNSAGTTTSIEAKIEIVTSATIAAMVYKSTDGTSTDNIYFPAFTFCPETAGAGARTYVLKMKTVSGSPERIAFLGRQFWAYEP